MSAIIAEEALAADALGDPGCVAALVLTLAADVEQPLGVRAAVLGGERSSEEVGEVGERIAPGDGRPVDHGDCAARRRYRTGGCRAGNRRG